MLFSQQVMSICEPPWTTAYLVYLSLTIFQSLLKFMSNESMMPSDHLILCCPLLLLPSIFPSIRDFSNVSAVCIMWPKYWSFSIRPSKEYAKFLSLKLTGFIFLLSKGLSSVFSSTTVQKHQFFGALPSLLSRSHIRTSLLENSEPWIYEPLSAKWCLLFNTRSSFFIAFCQEAIVF